MENPDILPAEITENENIKDTVDKINDIEEDKKRKLREYRRKYYKEYRTLKPEKVKQYKSTYYKNNKDKFQVKNRTCHVCNYTSTSSHVKRHERTKKHLDAVKLSEK